MAEGDPLPAVDNVTRMIYRLRDGEINYNQYGASGYRDKMSQEGPMAKRFSGDRRSGTGVVNAYICQPDGLITSAWMLGRGLLSPMIVMLMWGSNAFL